MIYLEPHGLRDSFRFRRSEWGLALILALGWGIVPLSFPGNSFESTSLAWIDNLLGETTIAVAAVLVGGARLAVLVINGTWWRCSQARIVMASLSMLFWVAIFFSVLNSGTAAPGVISYAVFLAMDWHTIYEAARDARVVLDKRHAAGQ